MHDVKKFFGSICLGLVIFTPTCLAAMTCDEQVKFSATFKWNDGRVSMITSNIDRQIADDTEVYNAARARIDVLAGAFTKPLFQGRRFEACNVSETCEAGKTLQDCSPALARCFAEIVAQDEYIANLQNRLCNSGINLNPHNNGFRDLITSYTPLRLSAPAGGGTLVTGSVDEAPVVQSTDQGIDVKQTISNQTNAMSVGVSFVYAGAQMKSINALMNQWNRACETLSRKPDRADTTGFRNTSEGGKIRHTCIIKTCRGRGYAPSADGLSCVLAESGGSTPSTPPAPATPAGTEATADGKTDQNQTIDRLPSKPAPLIPTGPAEPEKLVYIGGSLTFTDEELKNAAFSESVNNWERKCNSYPEDSDDVTINATYVKKDKRRKQNTWTCLIQSCNEDVAGLPQTPSPDGKSCISQDGSSCTAGDRHADRTRYDARQGVCIIETCKEDYTLVDGKCEKTRKLERQQAKATTRLEKDFVSDINKLSDAFEKVVKKLTKECEKSGGTINNGVCENAPAPAADSKAKAPTNRRGSGRK